MEEIQVDVIEIDGIEYMLLDTLMMNNQNYYYFVNVEDSTDMQIFKDKVVDGEECFVSVDSDAEFDKALLLFGNKYANQLENTN